MRQRSALSKSSCPVSEVGLPDRCLSENTGALPIRRRLSTMRSGLPQSFHSTPLSSITAAWSVARASPMSPSVFPGSTSKTGGVRGLCLNGAVQTQYFGTLTKSRYPLVRRRLCLLITHGIGVKRGRCSHSRKWERRWISKTMEEG